MDDFEPSSSSPPSSPSSPELSSPPLCFSPGLVFAACGLAAISQLAIFVLFFYVLASKAREGRRERLRRAQQDMKDTCSSVSSSIGHSSISSKCSMLYGARYLDIRRKVSSDRSAIMSVIAKAMLALVLVGLVASVTASETEDNATTTLDASGAELRSLEECPVDRVHFELSSGAFVSGLAYRVTRDLQPEECVTACRLEAQCRSVNIDYRRGLCEYSARGLFDESALKKSPSHNFFEKICLPSDTAAALCEPKDWTFERLRGKELVGIPHSKVRVEATSRQACEAACVDYELFTCRSAEWRPMSKQCRLSPYNRFSTADDRVKLDPVAPGLGSEVEYLENNCAHEAKGFCNFKTFPGRRLLLAERILLVTNQDECEAECLSNSNFVCRSFTFEAGSRTCSLSHHGATRSAPESLARNPAAAYHELGSCFEVVVDCGPEMMRVKVASNVLFHGKVYTRERPKSCFVDVANDLDFNLPVQLKGDECATLREDEGEFTNVLVIQSNDQVVTSMDKALGVRCSYGVGNKTTGYSSLTINDVRVTEKRGKARLPTLSLHIVDGRGRETEQVAIGELLRVQVRMSDENTYGIFVRNLVAKDGSGYNNLTLIDQSGCPAEAKMMREVRTIDSNTKSLESYFEAFSFTGSSTLELEAEVETCLDRCRPVQCKIASGRSDDDFETVQSYGRRRRSLVDPDRATRGDVVDERTLSKALVILAKVEPPTAKVRSGLLNLSKPPGEPSKNRTSGLQRTKTKGSDKKSPPRDGHKTATRPEASGLLAYNLDASGHYCFEANVLSAISGATLLVQAFSLSLALCLASRLRRRPRRTVQRTVQSPPGAEQKRAQNFYY